MKTIKAGYIRESTTSAIAHTAGGRYEELMDLLESVERMEFSLNKSDDFIAGFEFAMELVRKWVKEESI